MTEGFNTIKTEGHLKPGIRPITASLIARKDFELLGIDPDNPSASFNLKRPSLEVKYVAGESVVSPLDGSNKFTKGLFYCMSLIIAGRDKTTGENISVLTHYTPNVANKNEADALNSLLLQVKERCEEGTVDAVILGGMDSDKPIVKYNAHTEPLTVLQLGVLKVFRFEPVLINEPKKPYLDDIKNIPAEKEIHDDVYYDNEHRRVYFVRPDINQPEAK